MDVAIEPTDRDVEASSELILVPMVDAVLMPGTVMPLAIGRPVIAASLQLSLIHISICRSRSRSTLS